MRKPFLYITNLNNGQKQQLIVDNIPVNNLCENIVMILDSYQWDDRDCVCSIEEIELITETILEGDAQ